MVMSPLTVKVTPALIVRLAVLAFTGKVKAVHEFELFIVTVPVTDNVENDVVCDPPIVLVAPLIVKLPAVTVLMLLFVQLPARDIVLLERTHVPSSVKKLPVTVIAVVPPVTIVPLCVKFPVTETVLLFRFKEPPLRFISPVVVNV